MLFSMDDLITILNGFGSLCATLLSCCCCCCSVFFCFNFQCPCQFLALLLNPKKNRHRAIRCCFPVQPIGSRAFIPIISSIINFLISLSLFALALIPNEASNEHYAHYIHNFIIHPGIIVIFLMVFFNSVRFFLLEQVNNSKKHFFQDHAAASRKKKLKSEVNKVNQMDDALQTKLLENEEYKPENIEKTIKQNEETPQFEAKPDFGDLTINTSEKNENNLDFEPLSSETGKRPNFFDEQAEELEKNKNNDENHENQINFFDTLAQEQEEIQQKKTKRMSAQLQALANVPLDNLSADNSEISEKTRFRRKKGVIKTERTGFFFYKTLLCCVYVTMSPFTLICLILMFLVPWWMLMVPLTLFTPHYVSFYVNNGFFMIAVLFFVVLDLSVLMIDLSIFLQEVAIYTILKRVIILKSILPARLIEYYTEKKLKNLEMMSKNIDPFKYRSENFFIFFIYFVYVVEVLLQMGEEIFGVRHVFLELGNSGIVNVLVLMILPGYVLGFTLIEQAKILYKRIDRFLMYDVFKLRGRGIDNDHFGSVKGSKVYVIENSKKSLKQCLKNDKLRSLLMDYAETEYSVENIAFFDAIEDMKSTPDDETEEIVRKARKIYDLYINGPYELNIPYLLKMSVGNKLRKFEQGTINSENEKELNPKSIFKEVKHSVISNTMDTYGRFVDRINVAKFCDMNKIEYIKG